MRDAERTSQRTPKIVETKGRFGRALPVGKPIVGVEEVVAKIFKWGSGISIGSRARNKADLSAGHVAKLRRKSRCLNLEFLQRIGRDQIAEGAHQVISDGACLRDRNQRAAKAIGKNPRSEVRAHAIDSVVIGDAALAIDAELARIGRY